ncbi:uncharacterized protein LOC135370537 [Ornithodoros turicata]|uniref:uncharacterized protein LOC135370537 n=1 Tax=Ornithodoros turicata TaxID=34597 RepID=UPI003139DB98
MASLVADYGSSESDSAESDAESVQDNRGDSDDNTEPTGTAERARLPGPFDQPGEDASSSSVFRNPFREEENVQSAIFERHVKMTVPVSQQTQVEGKKICWNYRKGRCRFGHNCKYFHDSDVPTQLVPPADTVTVVADTLDADACSQSQPAKPKNKRPGLSDGVQLSKKAMKFYHRTKT